MVAWYIETPRRISLHILDAVWPPHCVGCNCPDTWWCVGCDLAVIRDGRVRRRTGFVQGVVAAASYTEPYSSLIKALKYRHARAVVPILADYLTDPLRRIPLQSPVLVPIPLHPSKERRRGHNQSRLLAGAVSRQAKVPLVEGLRRVRPTPTQTGLHRRARQENVRDAFRWRRVKPKRSVILIDDVFTTGATLESAASACRQAGAVDVWGLVAARANSGFSRPAWEIESAVYSSSRKPGRLDPARR